MRLQDELREISEPLHKAELDERVRQANSRAEYEFRKLSGRAKEAAEKGERSAHVTIPPNEKPSFPFYALEELLKQNFDRYDIEDCGINGSASIIYVYWH